jgi:hypothetical protein
LKLQWCVQSFLLCVVLLSQPVRAQIPAHGIVSSKTGAHFVGLQFDVVPNDRVRLELLSADSSKSFTILDSTFFSAKTLLLAVPSEKEELSSRYCDALVLSYPNDKGGIYLIRYTRNDTTSVQKVLLMK